MSENLEIVETDKNSLSIKEFIFKYLRFLPLFIIIMVMALVGAFLFLRYSTPIYRASGTLLLRNDNANSRSTEKFEQIFQSDGQRNIQSEIEFIRSRPLMNRVVEELNLNFTYHSVGKVRETDVYKSSPFHVEILNKIDSVPFRLDIDFINSYGFKLDAKGPVLSFNQAFQHGKNTLRLVKDEGIIGEKYKVWWEPTASVAARLKGDLLVTPQGQGSNIITVAVQATNPQKASDAVNQLMEEYQQAIVEEKKLSTQRTLEFIDERLKVVEKEVDSATAAIVNFRRANNLIDEETQSSSYFQNLTETDRQLNEQNSKLEVARILESYLRSRSNAFSLVPSSLGLDDQTLNTLISAYNVAQLRRKELIDGNAPPENVTVVQVTDQIEKLRVNILENLNNIQKAISNQIADLRRENASSEAQVRSLPAKQQILIDLERNQQTKLGVYNILLQKREESAISRAGTISNIKVLEPAYPSHTPVKPNHRNIYLMAFALGLFLPIAIIVLLEMLNDKVTERSDIEKLTKAPILGEIGHSSAKASLVVVPNSRNVIAEQFRIIRSNLEYVLNHVKKPVIVVTSSFSGEGKSFVSINIGAVMALAGKKTVILEFDIRKPKIMTNLDLPKKPGLTNYLLGKAEIQDLFVPVPGYTNLFVLPCGPVPPNPSEILLDPQLKTLFEYLKENFDTVVMDTAPVGMVSDAQTLSRFGDATLYIVRQRHTFKKQVNLIDEFYREKKLPKVNIIVNDVKATGKYGYYGAGRYGYGYGYGAGYFDDEIEQSTGFFGRWFGANGKAKSKRKTKV